MAMTFAAGAGMGGVYSNNMFLFGPAASGGQKICDREQGFSSLAQTAWYSLNAEPIPSPALLLFYRGGQLSARTLSPQ